jgi:thiol-disulfide isomerase/thioredoxin
MTRFARGMWTAMVLGVGGWVASAEAIAADRTAEQILKDIDAAAAPVPDARKAQDPSYVRRFHTKEREVWAKRDLLALELFQAAPNHERLSVLMAERWSRKDERYRGIFKEIDDVLARTKNPKLKAEAIFIKARTKVKETRPNGSPDLTLMNEFFKLLPGDPRGADLLQSAIGHTRDAKLKSSLQAQLTRDYPDSVHVARLHGPREPGEWVGKPFDLEFTDAITGTPISMKKLKGKIVVIDFWATWCGPCVAEMPKMKELYAKYREQGVEFVGVSLDQPIEQGGLESLKKFVKEKEIAWPQYYQGKGWKGEFSVSWKIHSIPRVFVVDQEGKLYSVDARGKLETIIPDLLKEKIAAAPAGPEAIGG